MFRWWVAAPLVVACGDDVSVSADQGWPEELDVAFIEYDDRGHLWLATAEHMPDSAEALPGEYKTRHLGWSPCGDELAMQTGADSTQLVTVSAGESRVVADLWMAYTGFQIGAGPWWSRDGRYIAAIGAVNVGVGVVPTCGWGDHLSCLRGFDPRVPRCRSRRHGGRASDGRKVVTRERQDPRDPATHVVHDGLGRR